MDRVKPFDDDDMNNFAFELADVDEKSDDELLSEWNTEGPDDEEEGDGPVSGESAEEDE